jgi:hypothetical protein
MNPRAQLCRAFVVLYVVFLMLVTLRDIQAYQLALTQGEFWTRVSAMLIRLGLLAAFAWKTVKGSRGWTLALGAFLGLVSIAALVQVCRQGRSPYGLVLVAGDITSRSAALWAFCVAPLVGASCCIVLARGPSRAPPAPG